MGCKNMNKKFASKIFQIVFVLILALLSIFSTGCFSEDNEEMKTVRVCTFNIRFACDEKDISNIWYYRLPRIITQMNELSPDLIGFQEAMLIQYEQLAEKLSDYDSEFLSRDGKSGEGTPIFYKKDRFELVEKGSYYLNEHPDEPGLGWDAVCLRVASYVSLKDKKTGKRFTYFNTHLDHVGSLAQVNGIKLMVEKMEEYGGSMILSGDFNVIEGSETYNVASSLLNDSKKIAKSVHESITYHGYGSSSASVKNGCIDYIFVSSDIKVENYCVYDELVDGGYASDHYAVYVDLTL